MAVEPLTRRSVGSGGEVYQRLPEVEAQIEECLSLPLPDLLTRLNIRKRAARGFIREEALVYLCRLAHRDRDARRLGGLWRSLAARMDRFVRRGLRVLENDQAIDDGAKAIEEAVVPLIFDLNSDKGDFLQVRFFHRLDCLVANRIDAQITVDRRDTGVISYDSTHDHADEGADNLDAEVAARRPAPSPDQMTHVREHLDKIVDPRHREAFVLRYRDGFKVEEVAERMGVNERTVFNWLTAAQVTLDVVMRGSDVEPD